MEVANLVLGLERKLPFPYQTFSKLYKFDYSPMARHLRVER